jgi:alpha-amylase/alpha-mannosidase (GH57 family)
MTVATQLGKLIPNSKFTSIDLSSDRQATACQVWVTVHGHFYQPPRENPYLDTIERQPGANPFHDWNERIHYECYRPNAFARIVNEKGEIVKIVNNYEYLSFNIGPTLMSWIEKHDREVYQRILDADRNSCQRLNGHGNAIAQVYNHMILPLANERDKYTQIRWGKADFRARFGREPEGMWLAETAIDAETLATLIAEKIKFIILAPSQAEKCRPIPIPNDPQAEWLEVSTNQIDPTLPYRCFLPGGNSTEDYIDIFFYDGPISGDLGFTDVLYHSTHLAGRMEQAVRNDGRSNQVIATATDGETFGHHKQGTEKTLAYAFTHEFPQRGWQITNFAHYLSLSPPTWEVKLKPVTAWSCAHGVERWQNDCGCGGGGSGHQKWRKPLRNALDWLRDRLILIYEDEMRKLGIDPWVARDAYIQVIGDVRSETNIERFFHRYGYRKLDRQEQVDALRLLEMQRHALLMYTSCGWFFEELSRPEGVQILRYAARAIELAGEVAEVDLEPQFIQLLALAPSNIDLFKDGATVYRQLVSPSQVSIKQVAAHYGINSLFANYAPQERIYCYQVERQDFQLQRLGTLALALGRIKLVSEITWEIADLVFAVVHLGGGDFHCCVQTFSDNHSVNNRRAYGQWKEQLFETLKTASISHLLLKMQELFGDRWYGLSDIFVEERHRLLQVLSQETLTRLDKLYTQIYRDNYSAIVAFHQDGLPVPRELQVAAEIALTQRCLTSLQAVNPQNLATNEGINHLTELESVASEATHLRCSLNVVPIRESLEKILWRSLKELLSYDDPINQTDLVTALGKLIDLGEQLQVNIALDRSQELFYQYLHTSIGPQCLEIISGDSPYAGGDSALSSILNRIWQLRQILLLGQKLALDVSIWWEHLP